MKFVINLAVRELRSSWKRLVFFFLCIGIGVGSIVALRSIIRSINNAVTGEARQLMTADVQVDTTREWAAETRATIDRVTRARNVIAQTETIEAPTMARPADESRGGTVMIELKGIEPPFPLYGEFSLADGTRFEHSMLQGDGAVVAPLLLDRLGVRIGDDIKIGTKTFRIRGVVRNEPGSGGGFRLGPRVFVERKALEDAGLTGFGSRARRKLLLAIRDGEADVLARELRAALGSGLFNVRSYKDSEETLGEQFRRSENYLSLTGLTILVLGGIGISSVTRVFIEQKKKSIAILKCVGGSGLQLILAYLAQVLTLGFAGSLLGIGLAKIALVVLHAKFVDSLPPKMSYDLSNAAIAQGVGIGLLISVLFSALPLLRIRGIKPNMLLRENDEGTPGRRFDIIRWAICLIIVAALVLVSSWQAGSFLIGAIFVGGIGVAAGLLYLSAWLLMLIVKQIRHLGSFSLRQGINSLYRPGNQTRVVVMAVGLGAFVVLAVQSISSNLLSEFDLAKRGNLPNMYLIDVQKDQVEGIVGIVERTTGKRPEMIPTLRARIVAIDGKNVDLDAAGLRRDRGMLGREYVVTYRSTLAYNETKVAGEFWDEMPSADPEISIEEGLRGVGAIDVGSTVTFDIQGRKITARVTSVRKVDWRNSRTGFLVLFRPGSLESAPQTFVGTVDAPTAEPGRSQFQRQILDQYPNVMAIDVVDIVRGINRVLGNITLAVSFIGGFVLLCGVLILVGSIAMTKFQRIYESALLKTLGASRKTILKVLLIEYAALGSVAGLVGAAAAVGLSYLVAKYALEIQWAFSPTTSVIGVIATLLLVCSVGALSSLDVLAKKPLSILRSM